MRTVPLSSLNLIIALFKKTKILNKLTTANFMFYLSYYARFTSRA